MAVAKVEAQAERVAVEGSREVQRYRTRLAKPGNRLVVVVEMHRRRSN